MKKTNKFKLFINIFIISFGMTIIMSFATQSALSNASILLSFGVLLFIIVLGIFSDIVGVAVTTADPAPFHAMASKKNKAAMMALFLIKHSSLVATFANDVIGDIAGIISGAAVANIVYRLSQNAGSTAMLSILLSAVAAGLTVGGKSYGKVVAIRDSKKIVYFVSEILCKLNYVFKFKK